MEMEHLDFFFNRGFVHKSVCLCVYCTDMFLYQTTADHFDCATRFGHTWPSTYTVFVLKNGEVMYTVIEFYN
jgi:hypothetical protein